MIARKECHLGIFLPNHRVCSWFFLNNNFINSLRYFYNIFWSHPLSLLPILQYLPFQPSHLYSPSFGILFFLSPLSSVCIFLGSEGSLQGHWLFKEHILNENWLSFFLLAVIKYNISWVMRTSTPLAPCRHLSCWSFCSLIHIVSVAVNSYG